MDPRDFDRLARSAAAGVSRRGVLAWLGGGAAALVGAAGRSGALAAVAASAPAPGTCTLHLTGDVRLGPSATQHLTPKNAKPGEFRGDLSFIASPNGAVKNGAFLVADGTKYAVNGQIDGSALNVRITISTDRIVILVGTAAKDLGVCNGAVDGLFTGPQRGDLGDWHATAVLTPTTTTTAPSGSTGSGNTTGAAPTATTAAAAGCPTGQTACGGICAATQNDAANCGTCGTACGANQSCVAGACLTTSCPKGQVSCSADTADCADLSSDVSNCGACGTVCAANEGCCAGACRSLLNESNCGACGVVCAGDQSCENGKCVAANACLNGQQRCGGACVDTNSDANNCGACGTACAAGQECQHSACIVACPNGQQFCGQACVDITIDRNNCGACGTICGAGQTCLNFVCCDNSNICNGICIGVSSPANCQGNCVPCAQGEQCCGVAIGCIDVSSHPNHCGDCNIACAQGQTCANGACG